MSKKMNIGLSISRNYDKVSLEFVDEPIEAETEEQMSGEVDRRLDFLEKKINERFSRIHGKV
jgi:hypothetical protein